MSALGREVAVSRWLDMTQDRIDRFADATDDRQWIHVDPARAAARSPFGATIAHGFLTLALLAPLLVETVAVASTELAINYGLNRVRFVAPVPAGSRVRARLTPSEVTDVPGGLRVTWLATIEREGADKPACVAEWVVLYLAASGDDASVA
jgi:acyl dehydratase